MTEPNDFGGTGDPGSNLLLPPPPDPGAIDLRGGKSKLPMILIGLAVVGGIVGVAAKMVMTRDAKKVHAAVMDRFREVETDDVSQFWICLLGPNTDPGLFTDNIALGGRIEGAFAGDPLHFPDKVIDDCVPKLKGIGDKAAALEAPDDYREALEQYGKSIGALGDTIKDWAQHAKTRGAEKEAENKISTAGTAFHAVAGKAPPEAIAFERFLRCSIPDLDKIADEQGLLQRLFEECKRPEFVQHMRAECGKLAAATDGKEDKEFKESWKKFGGDERDLTALGDCFKKGRKGEKRDEMAPFGRAWVQYMATSGAVRKIGAAALKND